MENTIVKALKPSAHSMARGLGWFSLLLGATQLVAARQLTSSSGMMRLCGLREMVNGAGLLLTDNPRPWLQARLAGDALDLSTLASGLTLPHTDKGRVLLSLLAVAGITAADVAVLQALDREQRREQARRYHYDERSGLPQAAESMRGAARDFLIPADMKAPPALQAHGSLH